MIETLDRIQNLLRDLQTELDSLPLDYVASSLAVVDHIAAVKFMHRMAGLNEQADSCKSRIGKIYDWSRMGLVPEKMEQAGVDGFTLTGVGRVSLTADLSVSMPDKVAGYAWLEEHGMGDLVTQTVNASSLKAVIRRRLRDGEAVPGEIFKVSPFTRASITRA